MSFAYGVLVGALIASAAALVVLVAIPELAARRVARKMAKGPPR